MRICADLDRFGVPPIDGRRVMGVSEATLKEALDLGMEKVFSLKLVRPLSTASAAEIAALP